MYLRSAQWQVLEAAFPRADEAPAAKDHDAAVILETLRDADDLVERRTLAAAAGESNPSEPSGTFKKNVGVDPDHTAKIQVDFGTKTGTRVVLAKTISCKEKVKRTFKVTKTRTTLGTTSARGRACSAC